MKIMIECRGGVVQNIVATEEISIHMINHDELNATKGRERAEVIEDAYQAQQPDLICDEETFKNELDETLETYKKKD